MGETKLSFRRYEKKYLLSEALYSSLWERLKGYVTPDEYHRSTVCSLYYDRDDYHLIRQSIERPLYKEKLRLRSYNVPGPEDMVFVELKKKFRGVVYKRRVSMAAEQALGEYLAGRALPAEDNQIVREINWFLRQNLPEPKVFIACDRTAYCGLADPELRITFDRNIRWRDTERISAPAVRESLFWNRERCLWRRKFPERLPCGWPICSVSLKFFPQAFQNTESVTGKISWKNM